MAQNPDIQARAQAISDEALAGQDRLLDFTEYKKLPYIDALVREILRWRPVGPVGVPRIASQDDVYESYRIPKGATVVPNLYAIAHDPLIYDANPHLFDPARFLNADQTEIRDDAPTGYDVFGFGRRVCPGSQSAVETIWAVVVSVLSVFHIGEGRGENLGKYTSAMLIHPYPFEVHITPRSEEAEMLVRNGVLEDHDFS
jgi:cytochrome P450